MKKFLFILILALFTLSFKCFSQYNEKKLDNGWNQIGYIKNPNFGFLYYKRLVTYNDNDMYMKKGKGMELKRSFYFSDTTNIEKKYKILLYFFSNCKNSNGDTVLAIMKNINIYVDNEFYINLPYLVLTNKYSKLLPAYEVKLYKKESVITFTWESLNFY